MIRTTTLGLVALLAVRLPATAAPATPEEAQRLTALFERYVGHPAGQRSAVTVVPHGDAYTASLDLSQMLAFTAAAGLSVTAGALTAELLPQADGRWHVTLDGFPPIGIAHEDQASSVVLDSYKFDGLFDPAIRAFATATTTTSGSTTHSTGKQGAVDVKLAEAGTSTTHSADAGDGTVNVQSTTAVRELTYAMTVRPAAAGEPPDPSVTPVPSLPAPAPQSTTVQVGNIESSLTVAHEPVAAVEDLWQFLVAHASKTALIADQAELKTRLRALIPLSSATSADIKLARLAVATPLGTFGLDALSQHYDDNGPDAKGGVFLRIAMSGLTLPPGLVPAWGAPLLPTSVDLGQTYGPVDLKPGLRLAIDDLDLAAPQPLTDAQQAAVMAAFTGDDKTLVFAPSTIVTPNLTLKFEGETHLTKPLPTGSASVAATGLDKTIDAVRAAAADNPAAAQAIAVLMAAKALGKAEGPDSYSWRIVAAPGGDVTINGTPLSGGGSAPPAAKPRKKPKPTP